MYLYKWMILSKPINQIQSLYALFSLLIHDLVLHLNLSCLQHTYFNMQVGYKFSNFFNIRLFREI